ncbi:MAG TPA: transcription-repair coupling factor, partial [Terriglobales bacterium]|nr:transcription-repair coupling factor [Terriglobales bacterium]
VTKYTGGETPTLNKMGGSDWAKTKGRARKAVKEIAGELIRLYSARMATPGHAFGPDTPWQSELEDAFPYVETPDQLATIDEVKADMEKTVPMDRLVCGDVGYGKTEIAVRAAFKAVQDGKQVAVLVPTTLLVQQHLETFAERYAPFPVTVKALSRFQTEAESRAVVEGLADGTVDVVIGTHRLLQADIEFKDLGLLIIDEEHRFGVRHKEKIKQLRKLVHVLTLTATPIPRTLQMSLLGIRDLSVIETPPIDRLAIRTYVTRHDEGIIREAILRELGRQGQVFYVYNRVETIEMMARRIRELAPEARVGVGHGQMNEHTLEKVMGEFFDRKIDVLVCSAIIESGIDVPNANTIIIDRADHFGLAQLYQLRGRVGRSTERAYAYLMIPGEQVISRDAQLRLRALQELDDLGGGFKLAAHDLEIRGAGNLLGKQQSGHVTAVGFELYQQMMEEAIVELRGQQVEPELEPEIQLGIPAFLPEDYIRDEEQRIVFYRSLARHKTQEELTELVAELVDRYGPLPPLADNFIRLMDLRRYLKTEMIVRAALRNGWVTLQFHPQAQVEVDHLIALVARGRNKYKLSADYQLSFQLSATDWDGIVEETKAVLPQLRPPRMS